MQKSPAIEEWHEEGRAESRVTFLMRLLRFRFAGAVNDDIERRVRSVTDVDLLGRWTDLALSPATFDEVTAAIGS